jgi:hypothetical protein
LQLAFRELDLAANGSDEQRRALQPVGNLPRPWSPGTCTTPALRLELWTWLDAVVIWINRDLVYDAADAIPTCWPRHAHLVHELAVLADVRRRAELSLTSDSLEDWHRYALPAFLDRMRQRVAEHCNERHPPVSPASGRLARHLDAEATRERRQIFARDAEGGARAVGDPDQPAPLLQLIDTSTGELVD